MIVTTFYRKRLPNFRDRLKVSPVPRMYGNTLLSVQYVFAIVTLFLFELSPDISLYSLQFCQAEGHIFQLSTGIYIFFFLSSFANILKEFRGLNCWKWR